MQRRRWCSAALAATLPASSAKLAFQDSREIVSGMGRHPDWALKVEGHTDDIGGAAKNLKLSSQRAGAVRQALIDRGVGESRLTTAGYGASVPRETNTTLAGRACNRRVELSRQ